MNLVRFLCGPLLLLAAVASFAQTDTEFWFVAPEVSKNDPQNFDIPIYLRITAFNSAATVTISQPANPSFTPVITSIAANGFATVDLSPNLEMIENKPANTILNHGLHIVSTAPVSIYYEVASTYCHCNPELFTLKGRNSLGTNFLVPTQNHFYNQINYNPLPYNAFDIVATTNNTLVTITPNKDIVGHAAGTPFSILLNQGQTYSALAISQLASQHLFGSRVIADKPIAITMTDDLLYGITGCADMIGDQIVPVSITGQEYIAVQGNLANDGNRAFILGTEDNTQVFTNGDPTPVATINTGQVYNHPIVIAASYITTDKPVYVFQTSGFGCELGGALLPPIVCTGSDRVVFTRTTSQSLGLVISTLNGNQGNFLVNGDPSMITASHFSPVLGTSGNWVAANLMLSLAQIPVGTIVSVTNTTGLFQLGLLIGDAGGGCSYGFFSDFSRLNLGPDLTMCQDSIRVLDAGPGWNSYLWNTGATAQSITVNATGTYSVTVTDPGCTLYDTVVVTYIPLPVVSLGTDATICAGQTHTFDAGMCSGCTYRWDNLTTGAVNVGNTQTYTTGTAGTYRVTVTNQAGCSDGDTVQLFTVPPSMASVTISADDTTVCAGTAVTFTASSVNGGSAPVYQWKVNALNALNATNAVYTYIPADGDTVTCVLTSNAACATGSPATSGPVTMTVNPTLAACVSITASDDTVCLGECVTYTASSLNGGPNSRFIWLVNGKQASRCPACNAGTNGLVACFPFTGNALDALDTSRDVSIQGATLTTDRFGNSGAAYSFNGISDYIRANSTNLPTAERTISFWFNANSLATHPVPIAYGGEGCGKTWFQGINHGGSGNYMLESHCENNFFQWIYPAEPTGDWYHWVITTATEGCKMYVNGVLVASNSNYVTGTYVENKDLSFGVCVDGNGFAPYTDSQVGYFNGKLDDVTIYDHALPQEEIVRLYQGNDSVFTYRPEPGDSIRCVLVSSEACAINPSDSSNVMATIVRPSYIPGISISASSNPFCAGTSVTCSATVTNAGPAPSYQWMVNGSPAGTDSPTLTFFPSDGDTVSCALTSPLSCLTGTATSSNVIILTGAPVLPVSVTITASENPHCPGTPVTFSATPFNGGSSPAFQWRVNANNAANATNATYTYVPAPGDAVTCMIDASEMCVSGDPALSNTVTVSEYPAPVVTFTLCFDSVTMIGARPYQLKGGLPYGGQYSGPGVDPASGIFTPSAAGAGIQPILYSYSNVHHCTRTGSALIHVFPSLPFTCGNPMTDIRDGGSYPTVMIGNRCWMASNLDFGLSIPAHVLQTDNCTPEKYNAPFPAGAPASFYQWDELMGYSMTETSQGLCPPGWHIPSSAEWDILLANLYGPGQAGSHLKDHLAGCGFNALLPGLLYINDRWAFSSGTEASAMFWTSTQAGDARALARGLNEHNPSVSFYPAVRSHAFSARCLRD